MRYKSASFVWILDFGTIISFKDLCNSLYSDYPWSQADVVELNFKDLDCIFLLGNIVISKKFLRTYKIMVMHSNERGECCLHTLVDRKRKCYDNVVDVVARLHDQPILAPKVQHLRDLHMFGAVTSHELTI